MILKVVVIYSQEQCISSTNQFAWKHVFINKIREWKICGDISLGFVGVCFSNFSWTFSKWYTKTPHRAESISSGLIRLKSGEPFSFICITVVLWSCSVDEILIIPLNYCRYCCCLSFGYTRPWDKPGHRTWCLQGCSILEDCCRAEVEGVWCWVNKWQKATVSGLMRALYIGNTKLVSTSYFFF